MLNKKLLKYSIIFVLILITADILSKLIIYIFLPEFSEIIVIKGILSLYKTYNDTGIAGGTGSLLNYKSLIIIVSLIYLICGIIILFIKLIKLNIKLKFIILGIGLLLSSILIFFLILISKQIENINNYFFVILRSIGPVLFVFSLFFVINEKYVKTMFMMLLAGNAGNFLSSFYPPFKVVDFLRLLIPFNIDIEEYNFSISDFIFNLADIYIVIFIIFLLFLPVYLLLKLLFKLFRKNKHDFIINIDEQK